MCTFGRPDDGLAIRIPRDGQLRDYRTSVRNEAGTPSTPLRVRRCIRVSDRSIKTWALRLRECSAIDRSSRTRRTRLYSRGDRTKNGSDSFRYSGVRSIFTPCPAPRHRSETAPVAWPRSGTLTLGYFLIFGENRSFVSKPFGGAAEGITPLEKNNKNRGLFKYHIFLN